MEMKLTIALVVNSCVPIPSPMCLRCAAEPVCILCSIANGYTVYNAPGEKYEIAPCDKDPAITAKMTPECKAFFTAEFCFYECDVNLSKYRCATLLPSLFGKNCQQRAPSTQDSNCQVASKPSKGSIRSP
jgi:hypothetical protein